MMHSQMLGSSQYRVGRQVCLHRDASHVKLTKRSLVTRSHGREFSGRNERESHSEYEAEESSSRSATVGFETDWRAFRAQLVKMEQRETAASYSNSPYWVHPIPRPEKGCILIAHPSMFTNSQSYFYQSVVFVLDHDDAVGTWGIILNRASEYTLKQAVKCEVPDSLKGLMDVQLYLGGDVGKGTMLMHTDPALEGSVEVVNGIYVGGEEAASEAVLEGRGNPKNYRWFMRYAGWGPGQLKEECQNGVWFTAAASSDLITWRAPTGDGKELWYKVMDLMGGDYKELSEQVKMAWENLSTSAPPQKKEKRERPSAHN